MLIEILYEDEFYVIVNKPSNLLMYPSYFARNIKEKTLIEYIKEELRCGIKPFNRLDRKTSGIVIFGKTSDSIKQLQNTTIEKKYLAIVRGITLLEGEVNSPIKQEDKKEFRSALTLYKQLSTVELNYKVGRYQTARYSLLELTPKTGRMHQLRKHMNKISHPIIGDNKYGDRFHNKFFKNNFGKQNLFLHAKTIIFDHPFTKDTITITANTPKSWDDIIKLFE